MQHSDSFFHPLPETLAAVEKPEKFTFPFFYEPHPLARYAADKVQNYLLTQNDFTHNFGLDPIAEGSPIGKMFGVLVVEDRAGTLGFLATCSGKLAGTNSHRYLVPPIFDMLDPSGFFLQEEASINSLNQALEQLTQSERLQHAHLQLEQVQEQCRQNLAQMRLQHKQQKLDRKVQRAALAHSLDHDRQAQLDDLIKQSYRDQHHYDLLKAASSQQIADAQAALSNIQQEINLLKDSRKQKSAALQQRLFAQYNFLNAQGEYRNVCDIFAHAKQLIPPAGAGECAAPKLLQYAYLHQYKPICMAEFWWGAPPGSEVRKHKYFYPACKSKCDPILGHMLKGLQVDPNPLLINPALDQKFDIIYQDEDIIVINKPAEFLSVPGIHIHDSVYTRILAQFPSISGPVIIHRLDMSTSGILVLAKHKEAHQHIQDQFIQHTVKKRYTALLDGAIEPTSGLIDLPLRVDLDDRPRQVVCYTHGKPARTEFRVVALEDGKTRIHYFPLTGRTHQLRLHSAHALGLNTPIVGDDLYGTRADRLHLHAGYIAFRHPRTQLEISFELADPF